MIQETKESITLFFREGRSDKVYQVQLDRVDAGYVVNFQFGRRGSTLQSGTKTPQSVSYDEAAKVYERLVSEKKARGYIEAESGSPYQGAPPPRQPSGLLPQLLNPIDEKETGKLIADSAWLMQEKKDGHRMLIRKTGETIEAINRKGEFVALSKSIEHSLQALHCDVVLDGEAIGDVYWVFDLLEQRGEDLRSLPASSRLTALLLLLETYIQDDAVRKVPTAWSPVAKRELYDRLQRERAEGVVFKRTESSYVPGRPASGGDQLKVKFTATATCKVLRRNGNKRSVAVAVYQHPGDGFVAVGNVTIPPNFAIPEPGTLAEIRYLYAFVGGSLYQPVYLGQRNDVDAADSVSSLKYKQGEDDET